MISETLEAIATNIENAYDELETKGATLPANKNIENLADTIASIEVGGGNTDIMTRRVINWNGTLLSETEIHAGDTVYLPENAPPIEDPLIEFEKYVCTSAVGSTVDCDYDIGVMCRVKEQINVGGVLVRPTILKYQVTSELLSPTLGWYSSNSSGTIYIDWGDETVDTVEPTSSNGTVQHTYAQEGVYLIKMYSTSYYGVYGGNYGCFQAQNYANLLISVYFGDNFMAGYRGFRSCSGLQYVTISADSRSTGTAGTYSGCLSLKGICNDKGFSGDSMFQNSGVGYLITSGRFSTNGSNNMMQSCNNLTKIIIPELETNYTQAYGPSYFAYCSSLKKVIIKNALKHIPNSCFYNDYVLEKVVLLDTSNFVTIGSSAFYGCYSLKFDIPDGTTKVDTSAFNSCYNLTEMTIPSSVTVVGNNLFQNCWGLKKLTVNSGTSIPYMQACYSLETVILPNTITNVNSGTFTDCRSLKTLVLPDSITSINDSGLLAPNIIDLTIPNNWSKALKIGSRQLGINSLVSIANRIADRTGDTSLTLTLSTYIKPLMSSIMVDSTGSLDYTSSTTLLAYIQAKNWTVTFS